MAVNCTGYFRPCSYPDCSQSCIATHSPDLYACNDGTGAPGGYSRSCACGTSSAKYTNTTVALFFTMEDGCVSTSCSPSDQNLFWTTWVNLCLLDGYEVPRSLIPHQNTLGSVTVKPSSAATSATFSSLKPGAAFSPTSSSYISSSTLSSASNTTSATVPNAGGSHFSTEGIIGTTLGVVGVVLALIPFVVCSCNKSRATGRREVRWRRGSRDRVWKEKKKGGNDVHIALHRGGTMIYNEHQQAVDRD